MSVSRLYWKVLIIGLLSLLAAGCQETPQEPVTIILPTPTTVTLPTAETAVTTGNRDFVVVATDAPNPPYTKFDQFGNVIGFNNAMLENIAALADFEYEFVVTPHEGVLESIAAHATSDFDAVMSTLVIPETPPPGIVYSEPYLEVGQVLVVLADERELQSAQDVRPGMNIGVRRNSASEETARQVLGLSEPDLALYDSAAIALQALIDESVRAVIIDSYIADYFTQTFPEQLKIAGGSGQAAWISSRAYGIALAADNTELLERFNQAIAQVRANNINERLTVAWLILDEGEESIDPGESRVGTQANEFVIGVLGQLADMDPARDPDLLGWEVKSNTMSGLYMFNSDNELIPILADGFPTISEDKLEYTIRLRQGLRFPDGSEFMADDVKWSIDRSRSLGSFLVNSYLKDSDGDNFADVDAVQVIDSYTVRIILQEPTAYFLSLLATPPYFPISNECFAETWDLQSSCGGLGPYTIVAWDSPGEQMRLKANPEWPGQPAPAFENIKIRFYDDPGSLRRSLEEFQSIDLAWTGLPYNDFLALRQNDVDGDGAADFRAWQGPSIFKSYLIFNQDTPPWDSVKVRQAVAYALDREALATEIFTGRRQALLSPVPNTLPGYVPALPERNLPQARTLLLEEGYSQSNPLEITIWYVSDGRYSAVEEQYANAIKAQLEATDIFLVNVSGAPWEMYRTQTAQCGYPAYLLGWPSPGQPTNYLDISAWTDYFILNPQRPFCSNYENESMTELLAAAREELDPEVRLELYRQIQVLWATELPTLDITQEPRYALSLAKVNNVQINALGLLHYELLTKGGG